jgi:hypothetical protein
MTEQQAITGDSRVDFVLRNLDDIRQLREVLAWSAIAWPKWMHHVVHDVVADDCRALLREHRLSEFKAYPKELAVNWWDKSWDDAKDEDVGPGFAWDTKANVDFGDGDLDSSQLADLTFYHNGGPPKSRSRASLSKWIAFVRQRRAEIIGRSSHVVVLPDGDATAECVTLLRFELDDVLTCEALGNAALLRRNIRAAIEEFTTVTGPTLREFG